MSQQEYQCVVQQNGKGHRGRYSVATCEEINGSITFSLEPDVWQEEEEPEAGSIVMLSDIIRKKAGWRARRARYLRPEDSNKQKTEN